MTEKSAGEQIDQIMDRLSATGEAWVASGFRYDTPEYAAREAAFDELRAWNARYASPANAKRP